MTLTSRFTYAGLAAIAAIDLAIRYPMGFSTELGNDTGFIHILTDSIMKTGHAPWGVNVLSYFGLYALSYASGMPFLTAGFSLISDTPVPFGILLVSVIFSWVGMLSAFLAGRELRGGRRFPLLIALLFSLAPYFIKETTWVGSARGFVVALVPLVFVLIIRSAKGGDPRPFGLLAAVTLLASVLHHMGFLIAFVLIAYFFSVPFHHISQNLRFAFAKHEAKFHWITFGAAAFGLLGVLGLEFAFPGISGVNIVEQYGAGALLQGTDFFSILVNIAVNFTGKVGVIFPLTVVGLTARIWRRPKEFRDKLVLVSVLVLLPLLSMRDYISEFMIFPFVLLGGFGLLWVVRRPVWRRRAVTVLVIGVVIGSLGFSWVMKDYWRTRYVTDGPIPMSVTDLAAYSAHSTAGNFVANQGVLAGQVASVGGMAVLPLGGSSLHWFSAEQLVYGFEDPNNLPVSLLPFSQITFGTDSLFVPTRARNAEQDWEALIYNPLASPKAHSILVLYNIHYVLIDEQIPDQALVYTHYQPSPFLRSVETSCYRVWSGDGLGLYLVN